MRLPLEVHVVIFRRVKNELEFLILHRKPEKGGFWQNLTGGVEKGESLLDTLKREIKEETGISENQIKRVIKDIHYFEWFHHKLKQKIREWVFAVEVDPKVEVKLSEEHDEYKWCDSKEAEKLFKWKSHTIAINKTLEVLGRL